MKKLFIYLTQYQIVWKLVFWTWTLLICFMSIKTRSKNSIQIDRIYELRLDYLIHFSVFFCWVMAFSLAYTKLLRPKKKTYLLGFFLLALFFTYCTEFVQHFVEGRVYNPIDFLLNVVGAISAWLLAKYLSKEYKIK